MNKNDTNAILCTILLFAGLVACIAIIITQVEKDVNPKQPTKEKLTVNIIQDTLIRYHPEIYNICNKFEESVSNNENFDGGKYYNFKPYKTELNREYGVTHNGDYAYIHMTCTVKAMYQWGAFTHVQEIYEQSTPKYTFYKKYNDLDLTFLELIE